MHRSQWDLEVYAKDFQERRWQEAARRRQADEATRSASRESVNSFDLGIARFLARMKSWFATGQIDRTSRPALDAAAAAREHLAAGRQSQRMAPRVRPNRLAQPYTDMVVVARGPMVNVAEQPSGVSDC